MQWATLATLGMTHVIQRAEHRDTQAIHAKLDEVLHALGDARNELTRITRESLEEIGDDVSTCAKAIKPCSTSGSAVTQKTISGGSKRNGRRPDGSSAQVRECLQPR